MPVLSIPTTHPHKGQNQSMIPLSRLYLPFGLNEETVSSSNVICHISASLPPICPQHDRREYREPDYSYCYTCHSHFHEQSVCVVPISLWSSSSHTTLNGLSMHFLIFGFSVCGSSSIFGLYFEKSTQLAHG